MSSEDAEEIKRRSLEAEDQIDKFYETRQNQQGNLLRRELASRKSDKMKALLEKQAAEKAEVSCFILEANKVVFPMLGPRVLTESCDSLDTAGSFKNRI